MKNSASPTTQEAKLKAAHRTFGSGVFFSTMTASVYVLIPNTPGDIPAGLLITAGLFGTLFVIASYYAAETVNVFKPYGHVKTWQGAVAFYKLGNMHKKQLRIRRTLVFYGVPGLISGVTFMVLLHILSHP